MQQRKFHEYFVVVELAMGLFNQLKNYDSSEIFTSTASRFTFSSFRRTHIEIISFIYSIKNLSEDVIVLSDTYVCLKVGTLLRMEVDCTRKLLKTSVDIDAYIII